MKLRQAKAHMKTAYVYADLSYCNRRKVGCVVIKTSANGDRIISIGYNGTPPGDDNCCEDHSGRTRGNVVHAEHNAIKKIEHSPETGHGAIMFITTAPCVPCAQLIVNAGISGVIYDDVYRNEDGLHEEGIQYLKEHGVTVDQLSVK